MTDPVSENGIRFFCEKTPKSPPMPTALPRRRVSKNGKYSPRITK